MLTTLIAFLFALGVLVFVHELGHYSVARWCGVRVIRFSIGFGKPFLRWRVGPDQTEWSLAPIPLGGYVKMLDEREGNVDPAERHRSFTQQSLLRRSAIVLAGPAFNFMLAIVLYAVLGWWGLQEPAPVVGNPPEATAAAHAGLKSGDRILSVNGKAVSTFNELRMELINNVVESRPASLRVTGTEGTRTVQLEVSDLPSTALENGDFSRLLGLEVEAGAVLIGQVAPGSPAAEAGLQSGDEVLRVGNTPLHRARDLIERVREHEGKPLSLRVLRAGGELELQVVPRADAEAEGTVRIGAGLRQDVELVTLQLGPVDALVHGATRTWEMSVFSLRMLGKMVTGQLSWKNLSGPVAIADFAGQSVQVGWFAYVSFLALISVSLGVLNLLPIPVLDGGHLVYYALEAIKGRPLSERFMEVTQKAGIVLVAGLMVVALFNDLSRLIS